MLRVLSHPDVCRTRETSSLMVSLQQLQGMAPCPKRWTIYQEILDRNLRAFDGAVGQMPLARGALNDESLFRPLVHALDLIAAVGVKQDLIELLTNPAQAPADAYRWYFASFITATFPNPLNNAAPRVTGVARFLQRFPLTAHYLATIASQFFANLLETIQRVEADRPLLDQLFFRERNIDSIHKIEASGADTHKGGRQVMFLTFRLARETFARRGFAKIVYKPSDVELDYRICGDSAALTAAYAATGQPNPFGQALNLVERVNAHAAAPLPTYKILPRNPGSQLQEQNGALPIGQSYGYIEFLSSEPARQANGLPGNPGDSVVRTSDWLCADDRELAHFHRTWGRWIALARLFSWGDLHEENVIAHCKQPCPIDFEISCTGPITSLAGTQIVRGRGIGAIDSVDSMHLRPRVLNDGTGNLLIDRLHTVSTPTLNRAAIKVGRNWVRQPGAQELTHIVAGMRDTYGTVLAHRNDFLNWIESISRCVARFTPYSTAQYTRALNVMAYSPAYVRQTATIRGANAAADVSRINFWRSIVGEELVVRGTWPPNRPNQYLSTWQHDYRDFANHDIPAYYHRLDSPQLMNARGETVAVVNEGPHYRDTYFPEPTINFVRQQVQNLGAEALVAQLVDAIEMILTLPGEGEALLPGILAAIGPQAGRQ
jgi:hypothetical protein